MKTTKKTKRTKKTTLSLSSLFSPSRRRQLTIVASWSLAHGPVCILAAMTVHSDLASAACMPERGESLKKKKESRRERERVSFFFLSVKTRGMKKSCPLRRRKESFFPSLFILLSSLSLHFSLILTLSSGAGDHHGDRERGKEEAGGSHFCRRRRLSEIKKERERGVF